MVHVHLGQKFYHTLELTRALRRELYKPPTKSLFSTFGSAPGGCMLTDGLPVHVLASSMPCLLQENDFRRETAATGTALSNQAYCRRRSQ